MMKKIKKSAITKQSIKQGLITVLILWLGCCICAFANVSVMIPNGLATSGIVGVARILQFSFGLDFALINYVLTTIVVVITWIIFSFREVRKILIVSILFPITLFLFEQINFHLLTEKDLILASIFYGVINGIGAGLVYNRGYSFGGTDTIAKMLRKKI